MYDTTGLTKNAIYRITNKAGEWRYSHQIPGTSPKYVFWRFASGCPNRRVSIEISQQMVIASVWEKEQTATQSLVSFDLNQLESRSEQIQLIKMRGWM